MREDTEISTELAILQNAKQIKATADAVIADATAKLVKIAEKYEMKTIQGTVGDQSYNITVVTPERIVYDEDALREELGATKWNRITTPKIDTNKLHGELAAGRVSSNVVYQHSTIKKSSPYIKISENGSRADS